MYVAIWAQASAFNLVSTARCALVMAERSDSMEVELSILTEPSLIYIQTAFAGGERRWLKK